MTLDEAVEKAIDKATREVILKSTYCVVDIAIYNAVELKTERKSYEITCATLLYSILHGYIERVIEFNIKRACDNEPG